MSHGNNLLQALKSNRTSILQAEIGAYLHDLGKAREKFIASKAKDSPVKDDDHGDLSIFSPSLQDLLSEIQVEICGKQATLGRFIGEHHALWSEALSKLVILLRPGSQGYDGMDSGLDKGDASCKQNLGQTFIATAFGYEPVTSKIEDKNPVKLEKELQKQVEDALDEYRRNQDIVNLRRTIIKGTKKYYLQFLGETRRSANDVTLWDHSYSVATLFKCAVAKNVLNCAESSFDPLMFKWALLSINIDILNILAKGIKIGDILGYKTKIDETLNNVANLIENEFPLGNEIYRDTTGSYFLIPDVDFSELKEAIPDVIEKVEPELMPAIMVNELDEFTFPSDGMEWKERKKLEKERKKALRELFSETSQIVFQELSYPTSSKRFSSDNFTEDWNNKEICPICRLRSMPINSEGCDHCIGERRRRNAKDWIKNVEGLTNNPKQTIWLDEVSDHNDRVALLVGCFILDKWLDGTFIKTLAIHTNIEQKLADSKKEPKPTTPKNPSPARIRRVWETAQNFIIDSVHEDVLYNFSYAKDTPVPELRGKRIRLKIEPTPHISSEGATLDIAVEGVWFSPVCINAEEGIFVTTINLQILGRWGNTLDEIANYMRGKEIKIRNGKPENGPWKIVESSLAEEAFQNYLPLVNIYDAPDQFMAVVPAYDALEIAEKIAREYDTQFSKVKDRLPFHIGIIAFHRKTPLQIAMDAGRRLIEAFKKHHETIQATIQATLDSSEPSIEPADPRLGKFKRLLLQPNLRYSPVPLTWNVSYSTGDPSQDDEWHPYFRFVGGDPQREPYSFKYDDNGNYVVHVKALQREDIVKIDTSYLKLSYIENSTDRFKVTEDLRPLDDIWRLKQLWVTIKEKKWSTSQIYAYRQEVMKRYKDYKGNKGDIVWENFVKAALKNILELQAPSDEERIFQATKDGLLDLCLHWHLQVRKIKPEKLDVNP